MCTHTQQTYFDYVVTMKFMLAFFSLKKKTLSYHRLDIYGNKLFTFVHKSLAKFEIFYRELSDPDLTNVITASIVFPNLSYN